MKSKVTKATKTPKQSKAKPVPITEVAAKAVVATKTEAAKPAVLAAGGLPFSEFQPNIRTAVHPGESKKRKVLNPQPMLDAKTEALKTKGIKLAWAGRAWHAGNKTFSSMEMSKYTVEEFAALFPAK